MTTRYVLSADIGTLGPVALQAGASLPFTITDLDVTVTDSGGTLFLGMVSGVTGGTTWTFYPFSPSDSAAQAYALATPSSYSGAPGVNLGWTIAGPSVAPVSLIRHPIVVPATSAMILTYSGTTGCFLNLFIEE